MSLRTLALVSLAVGCGRASEDSAELCVVPSEDSDLWTEPEPEPVEVVAGDTLLLRATDSYGCHTADHTVACTVVEESPGVFVVTTETTWRRKEPLSLNCEYFIATSEGFCETPPLPDGPVVLKYAGTALSFDVPGSAGICLPGKPFDE